MSEIIDLLTKNDKDVIREAIKNLIIKYFEKDLEESDSYLFNPSKLENIVEDAINEIVEELKEDYKDIIRNKLKNGLNKKLNELFNEAKL